MTGLQRVGSIVWIGLRAILRHKMRSSLTVLGIVFGVGCVITMVAIGAGAAKSIESSIAAMGSNFIMIFPGAVTQSGARIHTGQSTLTEEDAVAIKTECPSVAYVSPSSRTAAQVVAGEQNWGTQIQGAGVEWPFIRAWNVSEGSFFTEGDVKGAAKVAVLGRTVADALFPQGGAVGQTVRIKNVPFRVVGVLEAKGGSQVGQDQDDTIVAPYTTVLKRLEGRNRLGAIIVAAADPALVSQAMSEMESLLRQRRRLQPGQDNDFMMRSQEEIAAFANQNASTISTLLGWAALISLLVGGIGVMNIMLVSVTERTREIGVRMAVGAKGRDVLSQFLIEAIVLSLVGGALGIGGGILVSRMIAENAGWPVEVTPASIAMAFGTAALIGIIFGFYPAWKASKLDPIEALRYE